MGSGFPAGCGTWAVWLLAAPTIRTLVPGHTAREAWEAARPDLLDKATAAKRVAVVGFADCGYECVSDDTRLLDEKPKAVRYVGAERPMLEGSGRA